MTFVLSEAPRILGVSSADVNLNDAANLSCVVSSFPTSNVTWMFKGRKLQPPSAKYLFFDSLSTITVLKVSFEDTGLYECTLFNELGQARANASLTVGLKVKFIAKPKDKFVNEGKDVTLTCDVVGVPKPQLVWKKEGELVTNASKFTITTDNSGETAVSSQLRIKQISREDIALYSCISWNRGGVSSAQARVITAGLPIIIRPPIDVSVISNANVSFYCEGLGSPEPKLIWLKDASVIKQSKNIVIDVNKGELKLYMVSTSDVAKYTCVYRNSNGEVKKSAVLIVDGVQPHQSTPAPPLARKGSIPPGTIIAIVVILVVVVVLIATIVLYKYCQSRSRPFQFEVDGNTLRPSVPSRVKNVIGKKSAANMYYNHSEEDITFDDRKPFVDHEDL